MSRFDDFDREFASAQRSIRRRQNLITAWGWVVLTLWAALVGGFIWGMVAFVLWLTA